MLIDQPPKEQVKPRRPRKETKERVKNDEWKEENPNMGGNVTYMTIIWGFKRTIFFFPLFY